MPESVVADAASQGEVDAVGHHGALVDQTLMIRMHAEAQFLPILDPKEG